jgi:hypothetical protein
MSTSLFKLGNHSFGRLELIKLVVYSALLVNFVFYIGNDIEIASHTLYEGSTFLERTRAFATTIDLLAWFALLFLLELETYWLSDDALSRLGWMVIHGIRALCILFLAHTLYAWGVNLYDIYSAIPAEGVNSLCQLVDAEKSYTNNLVYTEITAKNCSTFSSANQFYFIDPPTYFIVQDAAAMVIEKQLAWADMIEAVTWVLIILIIEVIIRIQDKNISAGKVLGVLLRLKTLLFIVLWTVALYWGFRGHYLFVWDEFMWIAGFYVIDMNLKLWREEIDDDNSREMLQRV